MTNYSIVMVTINFVLMTNNFLPNRPWNLVHLNFHYSMSMNLIIVVEMSMVFEQHSTIIHTDEYPMHLMPMKNSSVLESMLNIYSLMFEVNYMREYQYHLIDDYCRILLDLMKVNYDDYERN